MEPWFQMVLTIISSVLASSGLWAYLTKRSERKDVKTEMLVGLAHDRIMYLGMQYVDRGYVTQDEYENLRTYLYDPYKKLGGNGSAERVMKEVDKLPIHKFAIGKRKRIMNMSNKTYDTLKWIAMYLLPALGTLYFALAGIWNFPYGEQVVGTITAVDTFLGVILGISTSQYNKTSEDATK